MTIANTSKKIATSNAVTPPGYFASRDLAIRGWSPSLVKKLLGKADAQQNAKRGMFQICRSLFKIDRVETIEKSPAFAEALVDRAYRATATDRRFAHFDQKYSDWRGALLEAANAMLSINRYAKHRECIPSNRDTIYQIKNEFTRVLCENGYCVAAFEHVLVLPAKPCNACGGSSHTYEWQHSTRDDYEDGYCDCCNNTGIYLSAKRVPLVAFKFDIAGHPFFWHQPKDNLAWTPQLTHAPSDWTLEQRAKALLIQKSHFAELKDLIRWVIARAANSEPPKPVEWLADRPMVAMEGNQERLF